MLGIGIGGAPREHAAYGMAFPSRRNGWLASRRRWPSSGRCGPAARSPATSPFYPLTDAAAYPVPDPPPPIIIGGETPAGARLAGRIGDGWSAFDDNFEANLPLYLESLEAAGRRREDQRVLVGFQGDWLGDESSRTARGCRRRERAGSDGTTAGADGAIVLAKTTADVDALVDAVDRW